MTRMNWDKVNKESKNIPVLDDVPLQESDFYEDILKVEKLAKEIEIMENNGPYKIGTLEYEYKNSGFKTRHEFEDYLLLDIAEKQKQARLETCVITRFTGGKYKGFSYKEVWNAKPDYILWVYFNAKSPEHRKRVLQSIDLANKIITTFAKYE